MFRSRHTYGDIQALPRSNGSEVFNSHLCVGMYVNNLFIMFRSIQNAANGGVISLSEIEIELLATGSLPTKLLDGDFRFFPCYLLDLSCVIEG